jgi:hypothetical protein
LAVSAAVSCAPAQFVMILDVSINGMSQLSGLADEHERFEAKYQIGG